MTGILFIARLGSTRLSKKHLIHSEGKSFIEWLITRFHTEFASEIKAKSIQLILATSGEVENKEFETILTGQEIDIFYGSKENIPLRQLQCAESFKLDTIISVDGDDILCSPFAARKVWNELNNGSQIVRTKGLPIGLNVWGYQADFLKSALSKYESTTGKLETGWGRIFDETEMQYVIYTESKTNLRFTLDYPEDAGFFSKIIEELGTSIIRMQDKELIDFVITNNFNILNESLEKKYLENFHAQKKTE